MTDGGRDGNEADGGRDGNEEPAPDGGDLGGTISRSPSRSTRTDGDPFRWGVDGDDEDGGDDDDLERRSDEGAGAGTFAPGPDHEESDRGASEDSPGEEADDTASPDPAGEEDHRSTPDHSAGGTPRVRREEDPVSRLETRLEHVQSLAEDVRVAALNADLKLARDEDEDVERHHEELRLAADQVEATVDRIVDDLEALRGDADPGGPSGAGRIVSRHRRKPIAVDATVGSGPGTGESAGTSATANSGLAAPNGGRRGGLAFGAERADAVETVEEGSETTPDDAGFIEDERNADEADVDQIEDAPTATQATDTQVLDPLEFIIPGARVRDLWRMTASSAGSGEAAVERWILETIPGEDRRRVGGPGESVEFPPEVTEFTLDPDEVTFDQLVESVDDEE